MSADERETAIKDAEYIENYFKQAIELNEKEENKNVDFAELNSLLEGTNTNNQGLLEGRGADKPI